MRRALVGIALALQGLAHALAGTQVLAGSRSWLLGALGLGDPTIRWLGAVLWTVAMAGFVAAGFGALGRAPFRRHWRPLALVAAVASLTLLLFFWPEPWALPGVVVDVVVLWQLHGARLDSAAFARSARAASGGAVRRGLRHAADALSVVLVAWLALVTVSAPWHTRWGSTATELHATLPGDEPTTARPTYWIQHAITIDAPVAAVWPWLAQLGTDRGGFYSYSGLENLFGIPVRNADRLHPEWQHVETGGLVVAAPTGYLGLDHPVGWRLTLVEPGRAMVLQNWGAFVLRQGAPGTTRFIVRTRGAQPASFAGLLLAWADVAIFQPAHFIMERGMLCGVKARAERAGAADAATRS